MTSITATYIAVHKTVIENPCLYYMCETMTELALGYKESYAWCFMNEEMIVIKLHYYTPTHTIEMSNTHTM